MTAGKPVTNGRLGLAVDALRDELGLTMADLADRTTFDEVELYPTLSGEVPAAAGHVAESLRALADVIDFQSKLPASA